MKVLHLPVVRQERLDPGVVGLAECQPFLKAMGTGGPVAAGECSIFGKRVMPSTLILGTELAQVSALSSDTPLGRDNLLFPSRLRRFLSLAFLGLLCLDILGTSSSLANLLGRGLPRLFWGARRIRGLLTPIRPFRPTRPFSLLGLPSPPLSLSLSRPPIRLLLLVGRASATLGAGFGFGILSLLGGLLLLFLLGRGS